MTAELRGIRVLVTRPLQQQREFNNLLQSHGAVPTSLPCLEIEFHAESSLTQLQQIESGQTIIFTSSNAVLAVHEVCPFPWPQTEITVLAIGPATARQLAILGQPVNVNPNPPYNSEALLELAELKKDQLNKVSIITGQGGRSFLAEKLANRTYQLEIISVYKRRKPHVTQNTLDAIFLKSGVDIVTITSNEALQNLVEFGGNAHRKQLLSLPLVVNSQRGARLAKDLCFQSHVLVAEEAGNSGQLAALKLWNRSYRSKL